MDQGDQERAKSNCAEMVPDNPPNSRADGAAAIGVRRGREVPQSSSRRDDKLAAADDEGVEPKVPEQLIDHRITHLVLPHDRREEGKSWVGLDRAYAHHEGGGH